MNLDTILSDMISSKTELAAFLHSVISDNSETICAIDTEADSLHRHKESLCLIQFAAGESARLIDPLAIDDLSPLSEFLRTAKVWMHGADYDMTMLKREFGHIPPVVYDTQIGARLLGLKKFGLGNLVEHYFGVVLSKTSQKADWGKRPLTPIMLEYALNDVSYLLPMGEKIVTELKQKNRYSWFTESCELARKKVDERSSANEDPWRISGSGKLEPKALACLRALWYWRDKEAEIWDKPSFMVVTNSYLLEWALTLADAKPIELPRHFRPDRLKRFHEMLSELKSLKASQFPQRIEFKRRKRDKEFDRIVDQLTNQRDRIATELEIDGSLIISRYAMEQIAAKEELPENLLMKWQLELLGAV